MWLCVLFFLAFTCAEVDVCVFPYCSAFYSFKTGFSLNLELTLLLDWFASKLWDSLLYALELGTCSVMPFYLCAAYFRVLFSFPFCNSDKLPCQKQQQLWKRSKHLKWTWKRASKYMYGRACRMEREVRNDIITIPKTKRNNKKKMSQ